MTTDLKPLTCSVSAILSINGVEFKLQTDEATVQVDPSKNLDVLLKANLQIYYGPEVESAIKKLHTKTKGILPSKREREYF